MTDDDLEEAGGWAFPTRHTPQHSAGMTLRDYFAGQVMVAMGTWAPGDSWSNPETVRQARAEWAYEEADALLAARAKRSVP
jgi:hypothetical protein